MNEMPDIDALFTVNGDEEWYKDAIIYQLHVKAFHDSNRDGIGDFAGLTDKLDYLQELGVTALWLLPFYPSPGRDDGYDIADYGSVNPDFGTMRDLRRFIGEAKRRNLRVITELVINHTSDEHPWFKRARRSPPGSSARNWYVWSDTDQKYQGTRIIFTDTEKSNWTWDPEAKAYYWHRFFSHQPDLNFDNPRVVSAVVQVMKRWLDAGVDGFRLDAIPYLCERDGTNNENLPETHQVIKAIRKELDAYSRGKVLLAEANQWPEDVQHYFGDDDECHMAYHFPLMPRIYMAIAQEDRFPIVDILRQTPDIPAKCQWAMFLRNHDELTLEMVTDAERDYLWSTYANDPRARINVGIRRRLAPLMDNDRRKIELMNSLLLSFPGTPIIYYGDEIGMGDNIYLGDRNGVRTPMQWTPDRNGGFSRCDPARLYSPPVMDAVYGYEAVNVEAQSRSVSSLLSWTKKLISVRKSVQTFGRGSMTFVSASNRCVLAYLRQHENSVILCVANLSRSAQPTELDLSAWKGRSPIEMLGRIPFPEIGELPYLITLAPYGFYWFELTEKQPSQNVSAQTVPEYPTLVVPPGSTWLTLSRTRGIFERDVLPVHLSHTRWFPERTARAISIKLAGAIPFATEGEARPWLLLFDAKYRDHSGRYAMPIQINWDRLDRKSYDPKAIAAVRQVSREGTLRDVANEKGLAAQTIKNIRDRAQISEGDFRLDFVPTEQLASVPDESVQSVRGIQSEQSNTTSLIDDRYVLKMYRKLENGLNPEIEVGRFLTDVAGFAHTPALLGSIELSGPDFNSAVGIVHAFVENQGDAWSVTTLALDRFVENLRLVNAPDLSPEQDEKAAYQNYMSKTGARVAEMQIALASRSDIDAFRPEPVTPDGVERWVTNVIERSSSIFDRLARSGKDGADAGLIDALLSARETLRDRLMALVPTGAQFVNIRHHGDFHLGQMLVVRDDVFIIDFEGEPRRSLLERRSKSAAARDVAGLIRSIDYSTSAALSRARKVGADDDGRIATAVASWRETATTTFLDAYRQSMIDERLWPSDRAQADGVLKFFLIEKAFYEIGYEQAHRPDWLSVPLRGALRILGLEPKERET